MSATAKLHADVSNVELTAHRSPLVPRSGQSPLDFAQVSQKRVRVIATVATLLLHAGIVGLAAIASIQSPTPVRSFPTVPVTELIEVEIPEPVPSKPAPVAVHLPPRGTDPKPAAPPPAAAAQAAQVLAAKEEPDKGDEADSIVTGKGAAFAGGVTAPTGVVPTAVHGSTGFSAQGDFGRAPGLAGGAVWDCPFPEEADEAGIDHAVVTLRVNVEPDGRVNQAVAANDPGNGFAREARRCALSKRWTAGLDRSGAPTRSVAVVNVKFDR